MSFVCSESRILLSTFTETCQSSIWIFDRTDNDQALSLLLTTTAAGTAGRAHFHEEPQQNMTQPEQSKVKLQRKKNKKGINQHDGK